MINKKVREFFTLPDITLLYILIGSITPFIQAVPCTYKYAEVYTNNHSFLVFITTISISHYNKKTIQNPCIFWIFCTFCDIFIYSE